jgi:hypothetical protein
MTMHVFLFVLIALKPSLYSNSPASSHDPFQTALKQYEYHQYQLPIRGPVPYKDTLIASAQDCDYSAASSGQSCMQDIFLTFEFFSTIVTIPT